MAIVIIKVWQEVVSSPTLSPAGQEVVSSPTLSPAGQEVVSIPTLIILYIVLPDKWPLL